MPCQIDCLEPAPLDPRAEQTMVPMRDGVRLATDAYLPDRPGKLPAVLVRLPYDKCGRYTFMPQCAPFFNDRGYVFVAQDVRGKFRSEGETIHAVHEVEDGYDTLEWIVTRPWSDGVVGMWGDSYYGYTQWAAVASGHPALKAIVPRMTSTDIGDCRHYWADSVVHLFLADYLAHYWIDRFIYDFPVDWNRRPLAQAFDEGFARIGRRSESLDRFVVQRGPGGFSPFPGELHPYDCQRIPALHSVGWFDNVAPYSMQDYEALCARPDRASLQYLIADATDHENYHLRQFPLRPEDDHDTDDAALQRMLPSLTAPALDFFDVFLRGKGDPRGLPRVRWFLGHDDWHEAAQWPPPGARELRLYLAAPGRAVAGPEGGVLSRVPGSVKGLARWEHDPERLVPSTLEDPASGIKDWPDERAIETREDVLTFSSEPQSRKLDLVGPVTAFLRVGSSAESMHVMVKLLDVAPGGEARVLVRGHAYAGSPDPERPVRIDLGHTGYRLDVGHSLRLHVASSDFPMYLWHPGTAENPWLATKGVVNQQLISTGGSAASYVGLSVMGDDD